MKADASQPLAWYFYHILPVIFLFISAWSIMSFCPLFRYHDFDLEPGTTYSYFVTAFNKAGNVKGEVAVEMTDPAAPAGLKPPDLIATSSSSIHAYWKAPSNPNGIIVNYTLHVRNVRDKDDEKVGWLCVCLEVCVAFSVGRLIVKTPVW